MNEKRIRLVTGILAVTLIALIAVQLYWVNNALSLKREELNRHLQSRLETISRTVGDKITCFEVFARMEVHPNQGFYLLKHKFDSNGFLTQSSSNTDSVKMYFLNSDNNQLYDFASLKFQHHVVADITMRFEYLTDSFSHRSTQRAEPIETLTASNYRDKLSARRPLREIIDTFLLDSLVHDAMLRNGIKGRYYFGIYGSGRKMEYASAGAVPALLYKSALQADFLNTTYFNKPYKLALYFQNDTTMLLSKMWGVLLGSLLIVMLLAYAFWYFINTIRKQKRLSKMKSDFIDNMTHEFKTPLTNISLALQTIEAHELVQQPKLRQFLNIISEENERLRCNVERVLHIASVEKPDFELNPEPVEVNSLLERVASTFRIQGQHIDIITRAEATPSTVYADEVHLTNIIYNLLDNAIKYSPGATQVCSGSRNAENGIVIYVEDKGIGMNEATQKRIFEKFYRAQSGNIHDVKGFGLGLSYVKTVVEALKGEIHVKSEPGKGSRFEVLLPAA